MLRTVPCIIFLVVCSVYDIYKYAGINGFKETFYMFICFLFYSIVLICIVTLILVPLVKLYDWARRNC